MKSIPNSYLIDTLYKKEVTVLIYEKTKKNTFSLRLTEELKNSVKNKANELGISENAVISLAVNNYVKSQ